MTQNEFIILCSKYTIAPSIALECPDVVVALKTRNDEAVKQALEENF